MERQDVFGVHALDREHGDVAGRQSTSAGSAAAGSRNARSPSGERTARPSGADRLEMGAARHQHHVVARRGQVSADHSTDRARSDDHPSHHRHDTGARSRNAW